MSIILGLALYAEQPQFFDDLIDIGFRECGEHVGAETVKEIFDRVGTPGGYLSSVTITMITWTLPGLHAGIKRSALPSSI